MSSSVMERAQAPSLEDLQRQLEAEREKNARLEQGLQDLKRARELTSTVIQTDRRRSELISEELSGTRKHLAYLQKTTKDQQEQLQTLQTVHESTKTERDTLRSKVIELERTLRQVSQDHENAAAQLRDSQSQAEFYRSQCDELRHALNQIEPIVQHLRSEVEEGHIIPEPAPEPPLAPTGEESAPSEPKEPEPILGSAHEAPLADPELAPAMEPLPEPEIQDSEPVEVEAATKICEACGAKNHPFAQFCGNCGHTLQESNGKGHGLFSRLFGR